LAVALRCRIRSSSATAVRRRRSATCSQGNRVRRAPDARQGRTRIARPCCAMRPAASQRRRLREWRYSPRQARHLHADKGDCERMILLRGSLGYRGVCHGGGAWQRTSETPARKLGSLFQGF
jgi:hypothetical protein